MLGRNLDRMLGRNLGDNVPACPGPNSVSIGKNVLPCVDSSGNTISCPTGYEFLGTWTGVDSCTCVAGEAPTDTSASSGFVDCLIVNSKGETVSKDSIIPVEQDEIDQVTSASVNPSVFMSFILMYVLMRQLIRA
mmetsp:Transcript_1527/g.3145  ORF Transcript_1527/g.3145 Transcript_1527/m.3145 type:complete len:135 (-) Transcript_1527:336-740(-)